MVNLATFLESFGGGGRSSEVMRWRTEAQRGNRVVNGGSTRFVTGGRGVEERDEI